VRNDGVNIAVPEGASIRAAEEGEVVYAGNELRGFGNLVLIQHRGGYVTAYAHNSRWTCSVATASIAAM
jgi:murein DD-endopeptidase MepM/ murein hydrolase activator NlpD